MRNYFNYKGHEQTTTLRFATTTLKGYKKAHPNLLNVLKLFESEQPTAGKTIRLLEADEVRRAKRKNIERREEKIQLIHSELTGGERTLNS